MLEKQWLQLHQRRHLEENGDFPVFAQLLIFNVKIKSQVTMISAQHNIFLILLPVTKSFAYCFQLTTFAK